MNLKPLTILLVLGYFLLLLAGRFWAYGQSIAIPGFAYLHTHPSSDVVILFHDHLYRFDDDDLLIEKIRLADFGVPPGQITDFRWFGNGDLLLRQGAREESPGFNWWRYWRQTNDSPEILANAEASLVRCKVEARRCRPFTNPPLNLNDSFALAIDTDTGRVFVADTSRHRIYMLDSLGKMLDRIEEGLRFPNQLHFTDDKLYVANTNRQQVSIYPVGRNRFGSKPRSIDVAPQQARDKGQIWPVDFLFNQDDLWVLNARSNMADGGVFVFDNAPDYDFRMQIPLHPDADPVALGRHAGAILISDFNTDSILRFDARGNALGEYLPVGLAEDVQSIRRERAGYRRLTDLFSALLVLSLLGGFGFALKKQFGSFDDTSLAGTSSDIDIHDPAIRWIDGNKGIRMLLYSLPLLLLLIPASATLFKAGVNDQGLSVQEVSLLGAALLIVIAMLWMMTRVLNKRIGVLGEQLIILDGKGGFSAGQGMAIKYTDTGILLGRHFAPINPQLRLFPTPLLMQYVYPLLQSADYLSQAEFQRLLLQRNKPLLISVAGIALLLTAALAYLLSGN